MEASKDIELIVNASKKLLDEQQVKKTQTTLLTESWVCLNGTWMLESEAYIPVENREVIYGDGYVGECSSVNIFWVGDQIIYTPSIICGILQGTPREALLRALHNQSLFSVQEGLFHIESLLEADVVFSTSSMKGIQLIHSLDAIQFGKDVDILDRVNKIYQSTIL